MENQAKVDQNQKVSLDDEQKKTDNLENEMQASRKLNLRRIPQSVWLNMFKFVEGFDEFMELPKVCKVFKRIFQLNGCWVNFVEFNYPKIREIVLKENSDKTVDEIPWKDVLKEGSEKVNSSMDELSYLLRFLEITKNFIYIKILDIGTIWIRLPLVCSKTRPNNFYKTRLLIFNIFLHMKKFVTSKIFYYIWIKISVKIMRV